MVKIEISSEDGFLKVRPNVTTIKAGEKVKWDIDVEDGLCVEIVFHCQNGVVGPFSHGGGDNNPARGWYKGKGKLNFSSTPDQDTGMWKYDICLHDIASGQQVDFKDPWIKFQ